MNKISSNVKSQRIALLTLGSTASFIFRIRSKFLIEPPYEGDDEIYGALRDFVPFVQFKKREKHPWGSVTFSKVAGFSRLQPASLLKVTLLHGCFSRF